MDDNCSTTDALIDRALARSFFLAISSVKSQSSSALLKDVCVSFASLSFTDTSTKEIVPSFVQWRVRIIVPLKERMKDTETENS